jgi:hypothetical protein
MMGRRHPMQSALPDGTLAAASAQPGAALSPAWQGFAGLRRGRTATPIRGTVASRDTLVLYIYGNTDPEYARNLEFFVREGVRADWACGGNACRLVDYVIVVQAVRV